MPFALHNNFTSKQVIAELPLSSVLFEDDKNYPWLILVPRREAVSKIMDLDSKDQLQLLRELDLAQNVLWIGFKPTQLNVAAICNKTPQLHLHVIARFEKDPAWPQTVWDHPVREKCDECLKHSRIETIKKHLNNLETP